MWRFLFSRLFLQLLRLLLVPAVALVFGTFILIIITIISYIYMVVNTLQIISKNPALGIILLFVEIFVFLGIIWVLYKSYYYVKKKFHNKLQEDHR